MSSGTDFSERKLLEHLLGVVAYAMPPGTWLGFATADPGEAGSFANEASGGGYARVLVDWPATGGGAQVGGAYEMANDAATTFAVSSGAWSAGVNMTHAFLADAAVAGNMLRKAALAAPFAVNAANQQIVVAVGDLTASEA